MKILNLYAGIGGNRKLWGDNHEITAVEYNQEIADIYKTFYPNDNVVVGDAHEYLLNHFMEYDFIWSSPPCQTHSRINTDGQMKPRFPDMKLWQEIIFLNNNWFKGKYVVENVVPYYKPLIPPIINLDRHLFWSNFLIPNIKTEKACSIEKQNSKERFGINISKFKTKHRKVQLLRNMVNPVIGKHILDVAEGIYISKQTSQTKLF